MSLRKKSQLLLRVFPAGRPALRLIVDAVPAMLTMTIAADPV